MATGTLTGQTIANTYKALLKITGTDAGGTTLAADAVIVIEDGDGNPSSLSLSQQRATITLGSGAGDDFIVDGTTLVVEGDNNRVGIGTASPEENLHVSGAGIVEIKVQSTDDDARFHAHAVDAQPALLTLTSGTDNSTDSFTIATHQTAKDLRFIPSQDPGDDPVVTILQDGKVGIGTTAPASTQGYTGILEIANASDTALVLHSEVGTDPNKWEIGNNTSGVLQFAHSIANNGSTGTKMVIDGDGNVGIGATSPAAHLDVTDSTINTDASFTGIYSNHTKTLGASDASDNFRGIDSYFNFNDLDAGFGSLYNYRGHTQIGALTEDDVESGDLGGVYTAVVVDSGCDVDVNNLYGINNFVNIDAGTVDSTVFGLYQSVDIDGGTFLDNVMGVAFDFDTTVNPGGNCWGMLLNMGCAGMDATGDTFLRCYDTQNGDIVAIITALAGVATFDSGDFSGAPDYAEYFESKDGNAIAVGKTVKLDGDKVVACSEGDTPIGVVRPDGVGTSAYKAGAQNLRWQGKYLYDDFNELQHEDYTIKQWTEEITFDEYIARGKDETGGVLGGHVKDEKVEGSKAIPAKEAVTQQKTVDEEVEEEVTTTEVVLEDGKYVQKTTTETVTKTVKVPQYDEEDLYDEDGEVIGKHQIPIMETVEEAVSAVDAVPDTYLRKHSYHSDRLPDGVTAPDDAETPTVHHQRKKLNPDYDASKHDDYKPRPDRGEWNLIGLLGQIPITKGQPLADNWTKMKDVSDTVEMYFVK